MFLEINDQSVIRDIQHKFSDEFPFLKIEFYKKAHKKGEGSPNNDKINHYRKIGEIRTKHKGGVLKLHAEARVSDVEKGFEEKFGLHAQVFRNMRGAWIQTMGSDYLTLEEQNEIAEKSQSVNHPNYDDRIEDKELS